jgi:predicted Zn-dependent protease
MVALLMVLGALPLLGVKQLRFRPGFNFFSHEQDVEAGKQAAAQTDKELPLITDPQVLSYVDDLGKRLAAVAPNNIGYPFTFKVVNSPDINAFALPGGFIYVNRATIEAAQDEAQLAGVIAHEEGHVVMRHATQRASEMILAKFPLALLGNFLGQSLGNQLTQLGVSFAAGSLLLKNSLDQEAEADAVGAYTLYHAGYDPHAMAQFFEIIQQKYPQQTSEFFSDHPVPEHRIEKVDAEIPELGPRRSNPKSDSNEFHVAKDRLLRMPPPPKPGPQQ